MAIDRSNVSGVLTSTFLQDTGMTRDQANTGVSLLWLGIVLLEIPSNVGFRSLWGFPRLSTHLYYYPSSSPLETD